VSEWERQLGLFVPLAPTTGDEWLEDKIERLERRIERLESRIESLESRIDRVEKVCRVAEGASRH
jgi:chaperonin cofactor prefoldin